MISGYSREIDDNCTLLGFYAASSSNFLLTFRDNLSVPQMGRIGCPETSLINYHYLLRNNAEERISLLVWNKCMDPSEEPAASVFSVFCPKDKSSGFLQYVGKFLPDCLTLHLTTHCCTISIRFKINTVFHFLVVISQLFPHYFRKWSGSIFNLNSYSQQGISYLIQFSWERCSEMDESVKPRPFIWHQ
jgi:hypothetical protein